MTAGLGPCEPTGEAVGTGTACPLVTFNGKRVNVAATLKRLG